MHRLNVYFDHVARRSREIKHLIVEDKMNGSHAIGRFTKRCFKQISPLTDSSFAEIVRTAQDVTDEEISLLESPQCHQLMRTDEKAIDPSQSRTSATP